MVGLFALLLIMPTIYGPQTWPDLFSYPSTYQSSAYGGADTPNADYPELAAAENVEVVVGTGPNGENVVDAVDTANYTISGIALAAVGDGSLASLQYDARTLTVEWDHKFLISGLAEAGIGVLLALSAGGSSGAGNGIFDLDTFLRVELERTAGNNFNYEIHRRRFTGSSSFSGTSMTPALVVGSGTVDDGWHRMRVDLTPSTVTGAFVGDGTLGTAVVASDGAISLYVDGVLISTQTGLNFVVNYRATTTPEVYYGRGAWHGFSDLLGPVTGTWLYSGVADYTPIVSVSDPCCGSGTGEGTFGGGPGVTGEIPVVNPNAPYNPGPTSTTCVGGGTVPTAADLTDTEDWRTLLGPTPDVSCELIAVKHPDTLGSTTYRWSDKPLDLPAESAFVEGRVRRGGWSEIRRAMALPDQYPEVSRAGVTIDEQDALIRTLLDDDSTAYLSARDWIQWLVSETGRKASTAMRCLFRGVVAALNPGPGRTYTIEAEDQITSPFGVFNLDKLIPQAVMDYTFFGPGRAFYPSTGQPSMGLHKDLVGKPIPIIAGVQSDRGAVSAPDENGVTYSAEKGAVPVIWTGDVFLPGHGVQIFGELLIGLGAMAGVEDVYGSDTGYDPGGVIPVPARAPKRKLLDPGSYGVDVFVPNGAGWPFATPYIERTVNGQTLRYTAIYMRGPRMEDHRRGLVTVTVNVCGPEDVGDGTGVMYDQAGPIVQWFYNEHLAKNAGQGYRSGNWGPLETYASDATVPYLQPTTFTAFQDYTKDRLGNAVGYKAGFQLREQITLRELEKRFMQDLEISLPFNHFGQKMLRWIDDLADPTVGTLYRERIEIDEPLPPYRDAHDEIENRVPFRFDYDYDLQQWRREPESLQDDNSIAAYRGVYEGGKRRADGQPASPYEVYSTNDPATVRDVFARRLLRKRKAPRYQPIPSNLAALHDEIGDQIRVTHSRGVGATGYVERPFYVLEQRHNPNRHTVALGALDLEAIVYGVGGWAVDGADDWSTADAAERSAGFFWAAEDGTLPPDNSPGKEWR